MSGFTDRIIASMAGGLVVSCQAYPGEPLRHPETMAQMAAAVEAGGAVAVRAQGLSDVSAVKGRVSVPVVGIWKEGDEGIYIPPTLRHARCVSAAGADVVALDGVQHVHQVAGVEAHGEVAAAVGDLEVVLGLAQLLALCHHRSNAGSNLGV